jgi:cyclopropane fatty-acyl-phospholipid synthase-like methyltransferase
VCGRDEDLYRWTAVSLKRGRFPGDLKAKLELLDAKPGEKILDIGCGLGWLAALLASRCGAEVVAMDVSEYAVGEARRRYGNIEKLQFYVGDALLLNYEEEFDKVSCLDVLEHFSPEEGHILLQKIHRTLKRGGSLLLCVPLNDSCHFRPVRQLAALCGIPSFEHKTFFSVPKMERELAQAGFSITESSPWFYFEDQLKLRLPQKLFHLPLIGRYLAGSVNIRALKRTPPSQKRGIEL